jgi:hypothetical protein
MGCNNCGSDHPAKTFGKCSKCGGETCPTCRADVADADVHVGCVEEE